jgi:stage IV sporulation protein B
MIKKIKALVGVLSAGVLFLLAFVLYAEKTLPDNIYITEGEELSGLSSLSLGRASFPISVNRAEDGTEGGGYLLRLFESVPIKQVQVHVVPRNTVIPGGIPFGIKMHTRGVMVVGMSDIQNGATNLNPAKDAGLKIGDILLSINGTPLERNTDVLHCIEGSDGDEVQVRVERDGVEMILYLTPVLSEFESSYKAGIWVRDSSAGIGTMTYINPDTMGFAGLGHAICDVDTGEIMPLAHGEIVDVNITGASAGHSGQPGELRGSFVEYDSIGRLLLNSSAGIYGVLDKLEITADPVPMALRREIVPGPASILATISGNRPQEFEIIIEKINYSDTDSTKNMVIQITDSELLTVTGGIVQGMSGSPILQDGRLVGAVTHVFVNDPTRGYGVFAENMEYELDTVT